MLPGATTPFGVHSLTEDVMNVIKAGKKLCQESCEVKWHQPAYYALEHCRCKRFEIDDETHNKIANTTKLILSWFLFYKRYTQQQIIKIPGINLETVSVVLSGL